MPAFGRRNPALPVLLIALAALAAACSGSSSAILSTVGASIGDDGWRQCRRLGGTGPGDRHRRRRATGSRGAMATHPPPCETT